MCGIVGVADFAGRPISRTLLRQSATLVQHRGPDGQGVWEERKGETNVAFGHQRLAVLDLSSCASQPMRNSGCVSQGTASPLVLVFNGEIYKITSTLLECDFSLFIRMFQKGLVLTGKFLRK